MQEIDLSGFELFEPTPRKTNILALSITSRGEIRLNERLLKEFPARKFALLISKNGKEFLLNPEQEPAFHFTVNGVRKDVKLSQYLVQVGIDLPARYEFSWNKACGMWHGICISEKPPIPDPRVLRNNNVRSSKKGGAK